MKKFLCVFLAGLMVINPMNMGAVLAKPNGKYTQTQLTNNDKSDYRVVRFSADWCGPCQQMNRHFYSRAVKEQLSHYAKNPVKGPHFGEHYFYIDADADKEWVLHYKVISLPTILILDKRNRVVKRGVGYMTEDELVNFLDELTVTTDAKGEVKETAISFGALTIIRWVVVLLARGILWFLD